MKWHSSYCFPQSNRQAYHETHSSNDRHISALKRSGYEQFLFVLETLPLELNRNGAADCGSFGQPHLLPTSSQSHQDVCKGSHVVMATSVPKKMSLSLLLKYKYRLTTSTHVSSSLSAEHPHH